MCAKIFIGISKPNLDPTGLYFSRECTDDWFISANNGALWGKGEFGDDRAAGDDRAGGTPAHTAGPAQVAGPRVRQPVPRPAKSAIALKKNAPPTHPSIHTESGWLVGL